MEIGDTVTAAGIYEREGVIGRALRLLGLSRRPRKLRAFRIVAWSGQTCA